MGKETACSAQRCAVLQRAFFASGFLGLLLSRGAFWSRWFGTNHGDFVQGFLLGLSLVFLTASILMFGLARRRA